MSQFVDMARIKTAEISAPYPTVDQNTINAVNAAIQNLARFHALGHGTQREPIIIKDGTMTVASLIGPVRVEIPVAVIIVQPRGCNLAIWEGTDRVSEPTLSDGTGTLTQPDWVIPDGQIVTIAGTGEPMGFYFAGDNAGAQATVMFRSYGG